MRVKGLTRQSQTDASLIAVEGSEVERGTTVAIGVLEWRCALVDEQLDAVKMALKCGPAQRGQALAVHTRHIRA